MTAEFIRNRINELNELIASKFDPTQFVLNEDVINAYNEIDELQKHCNHKFEDGKCIFCDFLEDNK